MTYAPAEQARSDILSSGLSKTTIANALALLERAHPYNGHVTITRESICDLWGLTNWGSAQRYLGRIVEPGIIHYSTNHLVYITFLAWPPSEISACDLLNQRVGSTEMRVGSTDFDSDKNLNQRVGSTEMRVGSTESARGVYLKSAYKELNEGMNESLYSPKEINQSFAILTDPEIRMSRAKATELAASYPFEDIRAFCCDFVAEGKEPGREAGLIDHWLAVAEIVPPLQRNKLWQRHRTPEELAEEAEALAKQAEADRLWEERQAQREAALAAEQAARLAETEDDPPAQPVSREAAEVWQTCLKELALSMPAATFKEWVSDTNALGYEDGEFVIGVPHAYARDWLQNRLRPQIKRILGRLLQRSVEVTFQVRPRPNREE